MRPLLTHMSVKWLVYAVCLLCVFASIELALPSIVLALGGSIKYQTTSTAIYGRDKQAQWVEPESAAKIKLALARLRDLGYLDLIDQIGGSQATILKAIAIHESGGGKYLENPKSHAMCAFQIMPGNVKAVAKQQGVDPALLAQRVMNDKAYCIQLGKRFLNEAIASRGSLERGLCQYNGQITMLKELNWCWATEEYAYMVKLIDGTVISEIVTDKTSPDFTKVVNKDEGGAVIGTTLNCHDRTEEFAKALNKMADNYAIYTSNIREEVFFNTIRTINAQRIKVTPDSKDVLCINDITGYMDVMRGLMGGIKAFEALFNYITTSVLNAICTYAVNALVTTIQNFMDSICLPLPDLSFSLSLPSMKRKGCNGTSLGRVMVESGAGLSPQQIQNGLHNLYNMSGLPAINTVPNFTWSSPSLAAPLRAIFGSANPGVKN